MPEPVNIARPAASLAEATIGFCGKLPARGDFITSRLPRSFVDPWYDWLQHCLPASRRVLGDAWDAVWNEAPIWRFALAAGICGPDAVLGLWMPSIDRIGRQFPLTFAATAHVGAGADLAGGGPFLAAAEQAGLDALAEDLDPERIELLIEPAAWGQISDRAPAARLPVAGNALWWSDGGPHAAAAAFATQALPDETVFISMLTDGFTPGASEESP